jgi:adenosylcobinamide-GDP ribazoletransferase
MRSLCAALQFLTILPVRGAFDARALGHSVPWFPVVGLLLGLLTALFDTIGLQLGCPPAIMHVASVAMLAALTGGLHLDGLADTADGFLSARPRERIIEIMRDSRIGTMGVLALIFVLGFKVAAGLAQLTGHTRLRGLLLAPVAGRCLQVLTLACLPYAHASGGLARVFVASRRRALRGMWAVLALAVAALVFCGWQGLWVLLVCSLLWSFIAMRSLQRIGGFTGDTLGATSELTEAAVLVCVSLLFPGGGL